MPAVKGSCTQRQGGRVCGLLNLDMIMMIMKTFMIIMLPMLQTPASAATTGPEECNLVAATGKTAHCLADEKRKEALLTRSTSSR